MPIRILLLCPKDIRSYFTYKATALTILNASPHLFFLTSFPGSDNHFHNNALKIYLLFEGENYRENIRHKEILYPLIHFPDGHNGHSQARLKPGASSRSLTWAAGFQTFGPFSSALSRPPAGSWGFDHYATMPGHRIISNPNIFVLKNKVL